MILSAFSVKEGPCFQYASFKIRINNNESSFIECTNLILVWLDPWNVFSDKNETHILLPCLWKSLSLYVSQNSLPRKIKNMITFSISKLQETVACRSFTKKSPWPAEIKWWLEIISLFINISSSCHWTKLETSVIWI